MDAYANVVIDEREEALCVRSEGILVDLIDVALDLALHVRHAGLENALHEGAREDTVHEQCGDQGQRRSEAAHDDGGDYVEIVDPGGEVAPLVADHLDEDGREVGGGHGAGVVLAEDAERVDRQDDGEGETDGELRIVTVERLALEEADAVEAVEEGGHHRAPERPERGGRHDAGADVPREEHRVRDEEEAGEHAGDAAGARVGTGRDRQGRAAHLSGFFVTTSRP